MYSSLTDAFLTTVLLTTRTVITAIALIFSLMILIDTKKIYRKPWAFGFIAIRMFLSLILRGAMWIHFPLAVHVDELMKTFFSILDLFTIISMWLGYGTVFTDTYMRRLIRRYWPFK